MDRFGGVAKSLLREAFGISTAIVRTRGLMSITDQLPQQNGKI